MTADEVMKAIWRPERTSLFVALKAAGEHREVLIPKLLEMMEDAARDVRKAFATQEQKWGPEPYLSAMFLLAEFRETGAYPHVVVICRLPTGVPDEFFGDLVTEEIPQILASVCDGDLQLLKSLVEDASVDEWMRSAAVAAMRNRVLEGVQDRDEVMAYFGELLESRLERKSSYVWDEVASCATDLYPDEVADLLALAYEENLLDPTAMQPYEVREVLRGTKEAALRKSSVHRRCYIKSAAERIQFWYQDVNRRNDLSIFNEEPRELSAGMAYQPDLFARKIGRNDPCICGSGKKFKKCCGAA